MVIFYPFFPYPFHTEVLPIQSCRHTQKNFLSFCRWNFLDKGPLNKGQFLEKEYMFKQLFLKKILFCKVCLNIDIHIFCKNFCKLHFIMIFKNIPWWSQPNITKISNYNRNLYKYINVYSLNKHFGIEDVEIRYVKVKTWRVLFIEL